MLLFICTIEGLPIELVKSSLDFELFAVEGLEGVDLNRI